MSADQKNILFVHGAWHGAWCWHEYFVPYFEQKGFNCYTFDLPFHGEDYRAKGMNSVSLDDYVEALTTKVGEIGNDPILIGHSMGGMVIQKYLEKHRSQMVILLTPVPNTGVLRTTFMFLKKAYAYPALLGLNLYKLVDTEEKVKWSFFSDSISPALLKKSAKKIKGESYLAFLNMLFPAIKINHHKNCKMLVVAAEYDKIFSIPQMEKTAAFYNADFKIAKDIAHDVMLDNGHEEVADMLIDWIATN